MQKFYLLWRRTSQIINGERYINTLAGSSKEDVEALTWTISGIKKRRRRKSSILRTTRTRYKCLITFWKWKLQKIKLKNAQIQARHNLCTGLLFVISTERFFYKKLKAFLDIYAKNVIMHFNLTRFSDFKGKIFNFYAASNVFAWNHPTNGNFMIKIKLGRKATLNKSIGRVVLY